MKACSCSNTLNNTGTPSCQPLMKVAKKYMFVPTYDSTGVRNKIAVATVLSQAVLDALINNVDKTKRWYPSPELENITGERSESTYDTAASGKKSLVQQGIRSVAAEIYEQGAEYKYQLDALSCNETSVYIVDAEGSIFGMVPATEDGYLYPIRLDKASFDARLIFPTDTTVGKIALSFDFKRTEDDALIRTIAGSDITADLLNAEGLLDISAEYSSITTTGVTITLSERFGSRKQKNRLSGLLISEFFSAVGGTASRLWNVTTATAVTIATFTESSSGVYVLTFAAQTPTNVIRVTPVKATFDFADVTANTFLIP